VTLSGSSAAQPPDKESPPDEPKLKLPALLTAKPLKPEPGDDELQKLLKARYNEAVSELRAEYEKAQRAGQSGPCRVYQPDDFYGMWKRLVVAGLEARDSPKDKVALLTQYVEVTREAEKDMQAQSEAGRAGIGDLHRARYERLDAEVRLLRAKRGADRARGK
jgi:hypothetical protein